MECFTFFQQAGYVLKPSGASNMVIMSSNKMNRNQKQR